MSVVLHKFKLKNRFDVVLVLSDDEYYLLSQNHNQYIRGKLPDRLERTHLPFCIRSNEYSLVLDPSEDLTRWDNWSIFDEKSQNYLDIKGKI
jgi:hypothetical protein